MNNTMCLEIHELINQLPTYSYKNIDKEPFYDGIYFIFENGEKYHNFKRIVRVGINREQGSLKERLKEHFRQNHRNSIFRKHIGRVFLNINNDDYIKYWDMKTPGENKNFAKEQYFENMVSKYIQENITFSIINVKDSKIRKRLESAIIATLNQTDDFKQSPNWLGNKSPKDKVKDSGMWIVQGLNANILTAKEFNNLKYIIKESN